MTIGPTVSILFEDFIFESLISLEKVIIMKINWLIMVSRLLMRRGFLMVRVFPFLFTCYFSPHYFLLHQVLSLCGFTCKIFKEADVF